MPEYLSNYELQSLEDLYARQPRDEYLPFHVARRNRQIRALIEEVKMWRESAGKEIDA
jgi:hypothetical protein